MHGRRRAVTLALCALALAACGGGDKSTGPGGSIAGTYTMQTVNGSAPPVTIFQVGTDKVEVTGGSVTMNADNTFSGVTSIRETSGGEALPVETFTCTGTYTRSGSAVTFTEPETDDCGGSYPGTWSNGNTLTVNFAPGLQAVFKK